MRGYREAAKSLPPQFAPFSTRELEINAVQKNTKKEQHATNKLQKRLRRNVGEGIADFNMIEEGDRIMVCLLAAKIAILTLEILRNLQQSALINFSMVAVNPIKSSRVSEHILPAYLEQLRRRI